MMPIGLSVRRLGRGLDAAGLAPVIARDNAWRATLGGTLLLLGWQVWAAVVAAWAYAIRACPIRPMCGTIDEWSLRHSSASLAVCLASVFVLLVVGRVALALWRRRFWAGIAARVIGWIVAIAGVVLLLVGGFVWLGLGAWIAFWAGRLQYDPPAWAKAPGPPDPPSDPQVIEGERV